MSMRKKCGDGSVKIELPQDLKNINDCIDYINENKCDYIWLDAGDSEESIVLDFLYKIKHVEKVRKIKLNGNIEITDVLYRFSELEELAYYVSSNAEIDTERFPNIREICTTKAHQLKNLEKTPISDYAQFDNGRIDPIIMKKLKGVVDLSLHGPKDFSFDYIENPEKLKITFLTECNIKNLRGIERMRNLHLLCLTCCRSISSIEGISKVSNLKKLRIDSCPKLEDISEIKNLENLKLLILENIKKCDLSFLEEMKCTESLECLVLRNCGSIPSIKFFERYPNLQCFDFLYTNIIDGDLTPCLRLKEANTFNKRHYNLKDTQLPDSGGFGEWWLKED